MSKFEDFNIVDAGLVREQKGPPIEFFEYLRPNDPVHWNPANENYKPLNPELQLTEGFWILSRYADVQTASRDNDVFSSHAGSPLIWDLNEFQLSMQQAGIMGKDNPEHKALRKVALPPFMPNSLKEFQPNIEQVAKEIVDEIAPRGECELVFEVASRLPVYTFCEIMGIPEQDREFIFTLGNQMADVETPNEDPDNPPQFQLFAYCEELCNKKRENPDDSLVSRYVNGEVEGEKVDQLTINMFFITLSIAGHETTRNTLVHFFRLMKEYPEQYALLKSDLDAHLGNALLEVLRFSPPVMQFRRTCKEDVEIGGRQLKKGDKVMLSYVSANRDEDIFDEPDRFDITRSNAKKQLAFGSGPHACLGSQLALLQLQVLIRELLGRLPDIEPTGDYEYLDSIWFHGIMKMPCSFTPEA